MSDYDDELILVIRGFRHLSDEENAFNLLQVMQKFSEWLTPYKIALGAGKFSPIDNNVVKQVWDQTGKIYKKYMGLPGGGDIRFSGKKPKLYYGNLDWDHNGFNCLTIYISMKYVQNNIGYNIFLELVKQLFIWCNGLYGYSYHPTQSHIHYTPGIDYETCIGGISWLTLFGLPYVEMFGAETLKTVPCQVEEFAENKFLLLTSDEPIDETPELLHLQKLVRKHLGEDAFFRHEDENKKPKTFATEEILAGKDLPNTKGYRSPDFTKYCNGKKPSSAMYDSLEQTEVPKTEPDIQEVMASTAEQAVVFAQQGFEADLDFSDASIEKVEEIMATLCGSLLKEKAPIKNQLQSAAMIWGAYIGEVIRRNHGGEWKKTGDGFILVINNIEIYPLDKVYKRLTNGIEDNVEFYYDTFKSQVLKK